MTTAGQFNPGYTAVPLVVVEEGNTTVNVSEEDNPQIFQAQAQAQAQAGAAGWSYYQYSSHGPSATQQTTGYSVPGEWHHHMASGESKPAYPAAQMYNSEEYTQYGQTVPASHQTTEWQNPNHEYQYQTSSVAEPQPVHYTPEGWEYYRSGTQHWNYHHVVRSSTGEIIPAGNTVPIYHQQHVHPTNQTGGQEDTSNANIDNPKDFPSHSANTFFVQSDGWQHRSALMEPIKSDTHPRERLPAWRWKLMLLVINILSLVNGYDVSNIANIQGSIYAALGNLDLLPWIALSYSVCNITVTPLCRKLYKFYDIKILIIFGLVLVLSGTALAGSAPTMLMLIAGRALMAFGAAVVYQGILTFSVIFAYPSEVAMVHASFGASFAFGILTGPVIGAAFAQNEHATWRWSFYVCLPIVSIALLVCLFALPRYSASTEKSVSTHFKEIDWVGHFLHAGTFIALGLATVFSGAAWPWGSIRQLAIWVVFVVTAVAYIVQQTFSIATTPERRIIPVYLLKKRIVLCTFLCTSGAAMTYGVALFYTPLFFEFTRGVGPVEAGLRLLSLTAAFIVAIFSAHGLLPVVKFYMPFFLSGGVLLLVGGISLMTVTTHTPLAAVMGFDALIGAGVGLMWNLSIPVCSAILEDQEERLDQATLHSIAQLGGTAISLSISAAIYQNIGLQLIKKAAQFTGFKHTEILALLSGAKSDVLDRFSPEVKTLVIEAIVKTISRLYFVVIAGAALAFVASVFLKIEPLTFNKWYRRKDPEGLLRGDEVYEMR